jgi:hypothetical protein
MDKRAIELIQASNERKLKFSETLYILKQPRVAGVVVGFMITIMVLWIYLGWLNIVTACMILAMPFLLISMLMYRGVIGKSDGFKKLGTIAEDMEKYGLLKFQWIMLKRLGQKIKEATVKWIMKYWRK